MGISFYSNPTKMFKILIVIALFSSALSAGFPRKQAPKFKGTAVINEKFTQVSLDDYKGKYLVLFFYPFDFTYVCPTELIAFSERLADFQKLNTSVLGVSVDSHFTHLAWLKLPRT